MVQKETIKKIYNEANNGHYNFMRYLYGDEIADLHKDGKKENCESCRELRIFFKDFIMEEKEEASTIREEAIKELRSSISKFAQAGILNEFTDLAWKESDIITGDMIRKDAEDEVYVECAICDDGHNLVFCIKKPINYSYQYALEVFLEYDWQKVSLIDRLRFSFSRFWSILSGKKTSQNFLIDHNKGLRNLRDFFKRIELNEKDKIQKVNQ